MRMRPLGRTGLLVSELCLGAGWTGARTVDSRTADTVVGTAIEAGVNFFDTADVYGAGKAEETLGRVLGPRRKDVLIATKVRGRTGPGPNDVGLSRHHIIEGCDASLKRLGTDYIDLYQAHHFDPMTPLEETLRTFDDLVRQGKVRYLGCSNFAAWQLMKALAVSDTHDWVKFVALQAHYSLATRHLEYELLPLCLDQGLGILVWSPLAAGFLSGKHPRGQPRPKGSMMEQAQEFLPIDDERWYTLVDELRKVATAHEATAAQAALNYLLRKPGVTSVIMGAKTPEQLADDLSCENWEMTTDEFAHLERISKPPKIYPYYVLAERLREREVGPERRY